MGIGRLGKISQNGLKRFLEQTTVTFLNRRTGSISLHRLSATIKSMPPQEPLGNCLKTVTTRTLVNRPKTSRCETIFDPTSTSRILWAVAQGRDRKQTKIFQNLWKKSPLAFVNWVCLIAGMNLIDQMFGIVSDGGSGMLETSLVISITVLVTVAINLAVRRAHRYKRRDSKP